MPLEPACHEGAVAGKFCKLRRCKYRNRFAAAFCFAGDLGVVIENSSAAKISYFCRLECIRELVDERWQFFIRPCVRQISDVKGTGVQPGDGRR